MPAAYDELLGPTVFAPFAVELADRATALGPRRVLELAAGTGRVTAELVRRLPGAEVTATDLNEAMVELGRHLAPGATWRQADAMALPFDDGEFDLVVCQFGVMFFPDKDKAYREVHRVLAPHGHYAFSVWDSHRRNPFGRLTHEVVSGFFPADPPQFYQVPFGHHQIDPIKDSLSDAGFVDIKVAVLSREKEIPNVGSFARGLIHGNPLIDQIRARGGVDPDRIVDALTQALHREFGTNPARICLQVIIFEASRG
jgi:SAM-dependent methyltransferase